MNQNLYNLNKSKMIALFERKEKIKLNSLIYKMKLISKYYLHLIS